MNWRDLVPWRSGSGSVQDSDPIVALQKRINTLFSDMGGGELFGSWSKLEHFTPKVNVSESADGVTVSAEIPGMEQKDIQLTLEDNALTISGERKEERERKEGKDVCYRESSYGSFRRVIPLEMEIDEDKVEATMKNGVLTVTLPKSADARRKSRAISVKAG